MKFTTDYFSRKQFEIFIKAAEKKFPGIRCLPSCVGFGVYEVICTDFDAKDITELVYLSLSVEQCFPVV